MKVLPLLSLQVHLSISQKGGVHSKSGRFSNLASVANFSAWANTASQGLHLGTHTIFPPVHLPHPQLRFAHMLPNTSSSSVSLATLNIVGFSFSHFARRLCAERKQPKNLDYSSSRSGLHQTIDLLPAMRREGQTHHMCSEALLSL